VFVSVGKFPSKQREPPNGGSRLPLRRDDGFTIIEVLIAAVVMVVGLAALFGLLDTSVKATASTRAREGATNLARQILEDARTIPYAQLSPSSITGQLQAMNGLASVSTSPGWQVVQRGVTYTVTVSECAIDDPKSGYGKHEAGKFCADSATEGIEDPQPENLKRITVDVKWVVLGRAPDVHQVETLTAAGGAVGLGVSELQLTSPHVGPPTAPLVIAEPSSKELVFFVSTPSGTTAVVWSLEGSRQSPAPTLEKATTWTFSWPIGGVSDGTYQVAAQAVNSTGVIGPPFSIPVTVIRGTPAAPKNIQGGFNTINVAGTPQKVAELKWQANTERNVIGYRVYNPSKELVCPASSATLSRTVTCIDFNPPKRTASNLTYEVVALYRKAEGEALSKEVSEGPPGTLPLAGGEPPPPGPNVPEGIGGKLKLEHNANGSVTISWLAPKPGGAAVAFYRIYRESTNYTSRYDVTPAGTTTYTDTSAATAHSYWVTAVSSGLIESPFLGPESG
jgi:prepilin-type N-terminal cleavage/methylation domain-containing protein